MSTPGDFQASRGCLSLCLKNKETATRTRARANYYRGGGITNATEAGALLQGSTGRNQLPAPPARGEGVGEAGVSRFLAGLTVSVACISVLEPLGCSHCLRCFPTSSVLGLVG